MYASPAPRRGVAWGTVTAGTLALLTVGAIGLVEIGGIRIPFRTAGPGIIVIVGVLILLAGLVVVIRGSARARRAAVSTAPASTPAPPAPPPLDATQTPVLGARHDDPSPLDVTMPETTQTTQETTEIPAAQGLAGDPPDRGHDGGSEAQSSH